MNIITQEIELFDELLGPRTPQGVPIKDFNQIWWTYALKMPSVSIDDFQMRIERLLAQIEGVRFQWDPVNFNWTIEYGTIPIELTVDDETAHIIRQKKGLAIDILTAASEMLPHAFEHQGVPEPVFIWSIKKWCRVKLQVFWDRKTQTIYAEFSCGHGCNNSKLHIFNTMYNCIG